MTYYEIIVRGAQGRKWFAAFNARTDNREEGYRWVAELASRYPQLEFDISPCTVLRKLAPVHYRPWETEEECRTLADLLTF